MQHALIERIADPETRLQAQRVDDRTHLGNQAALLALHQHADQPHVGDAEMLRAFTANALVDQQEIGVHLHVQRNGFRLAGVQILTQ